MLRWERHIIGYTQERGDFGQKTKYERSRNRWEKIKQTFKGTGCGGGVWTGITRFRIGTSGRFSLTQQ
jgi:hypothetical protein